MATKKTASKDRNYVEPGSDEHASLLGLVKDAKGNWSLADPTAYGPNARPEFMAEVLRQKVSELTTEPIMPQSKNPRAPGYAPSLWTPPIKTRDESVTQHLEGNTVPAGAE